MFFSRASLIGNTRFLNYVLELFFSLSPREGKMIKRRYFRQDHGNDSDSSSSSSSSGCDSDGDSAEEAVSSEEVEEVQEEEAVREESGEEEEVEEELEQQIEEESEYNHISWCVLRSLACILLCFSVTSHNFVLCFCNLMWLGEFNVFNLSTSMCHAREWMHQIFM